MMYPDSRSASVGRGGSTCTGHRSVAAFGSSTTGGVGGAGGGIKVAQPLASEAQALSALKVNSDIRIGGSPGFLDRFGGRLAQGDDLARMGFDPLDLPTGGGGGQAIGDGGDLGRHGAGLGALQLAFVRPRWSSLFMTSRANATTATAISTGPTQPGITARPGKICRPVTPQSPGNRPSGH